MKGLPVATGRNKATFRIEKFFLDCEETFQSQTMCFLQLPEVAEDEPFADKPEAIEMYQNS